MGSATEAEAGPWLRKAGHGYLKLGLSGFRAGDDVQNGQISGLKYRAIRTDVYGEIGLPGRLQLAFNVPWVAARNISAQEVVYRNGSFGDIDLSVDQQPVGSVPFTLGLRAKFPAYTPPTRQDGARGVSDEIYPGISSKFPSPGDDNVDIEPRIQFGHSFHPLPAWLTAEVGYRVRLPQRESAKPSEIQDGIHLAVGGGGYFFREILGVGFYADSIFNTQKKSEKFQPTKEYVYAEASLLAAHLPSAGGLSLSAGAGGVLFAKNTEKGVNFFGSAAWEF